MTYRPETRTRRVHTDEAVIADSRPAVVEEPVVEEVVPARRVVATEPVAHERVATRSGSYYAPDSIIVGLIGLALLVIGLIAMVRAGLDAPLDDPVVDVLGFGHTATLGIIEAAFGAVLLICAAARTRSGATFFGLVMVVAGIVGAVQTDSFDESLGLESAWAWIIVAAGAVVVLASLLLPRMTTSRTRVEEI
jgi:hypothetical protein